MIMTKYNEKFITNLVLNFDGMFNPIFEFSLKLIKILNFIFRANMNQNWY